MRAIRNPRSKVRDHMQPKSETVVSTDTASQPPIGVTGSTLPYLIDSLVPRSVRTGKIVPGVAAPAGLLVPVPSLQTVEGVLGREGRRYSANIESRTLAGGVRGALFEGLFGGLTSMSSYVAIKGLGDWAR